MNYQLRIIIRYLLLSFVVLVTACAKQGYPDGGPKDEVPPKAVAVTPQNESTRFDAKEFKISFDEYIVLKDVENNILVSPPLKQKPEYVVKGRNLTVRLSDTLLPNTTYLFQFNGAITDFTEGNAMQSYEYAFSTGDYIDTMTIKGIVLDAFTQKPVDKVITVTAYRQTDCTDDSVVSNRLPAYVTHCKKDGTFSFTHISKGLYKVFAIDDADHNSRYGGEEAIAFSDSLRSTSDTTPFTMFLFSPDVKIQRILKSEFVHRGRINIVTSLPMVNPRVVSADSLVFRQSPSPDTLAVWMLDKECDSASIVVSDESGINDTLQLRFREKRKGKSFFNSVSQKRGDITEVTSLVAATTASFDTLWLAFSTPVTHIADSALRMFDNGDSSVSFPRIVLHPSGLRAFIQIEKRSGRSYQFFLNPGAVTDLYGRPNDSLSFSTEIVSNERFGNIIFYVASADLSKNYIFQLTDDNGKIVRSLLWNTSEEKVVFKNLSAMKYKLQILEDADEDMRWTTGDYYLHRQPERIQYINKTFELRENWDIEEKILLK